MKSHVLQYPKAMLAWAYFTPISPDKVAVAALIGAASYIDREMPREEARKIYRDLQSQGWVPIPLKTAEKEMPIHRLRLFIYD